MRATVFLLSALALLPACKPQPAPEAKTAKETRSGPPALDDITLEKRDDGKFYLKGADKPFTGTDIEPDEKKAKDENRLGFVMVTPYEDGIVHGTIRIYYPNGDLQEELVMEKGARKLSTIYYTKGAKKTHVAFNAKNLAEGPYTRWHPNGKVHTEGTFDENEKFHGDFKRFDEQGNLIAHFTTEHGRIATVHFENEEMKKERLAKQGDDQPDAPPTSP